MKYSGSLKKGDLIIISIISIILIGFLVVNFFNSQEDNLIVEVRIDGELMDRFSLSETLDKTYETDYGINRVSLLDGIVSVYDADCRDLICVNTKEGTHSGDAIVCIPNRFSVEIVGMKSEVDAIAQ